MAGKKQQIKRGEGVGRSVITVRLSPEIHGQLSILADECGLTLNELCLLALNGILDADGDGNFDAVAVANRMRLRQIEQLRHQIEQLEALVISTTELESVA